MTTSSPKRGAPRARRATRRETIAAAARALREGTPLIEDDDDEDRPPSAIARHDLAVVAILLLVFIAGALAYRTMSAPPPAIAEHGALRMNRPSGWLPVTAIESPPPRLALAALALGGGARQDTTPDAATATQRALYASPADPMTRVEIEIRPRPPYSNLPAALALARAIRHGERYWAHETEARAIAGRDWFRTEFRYAYGGAKSPRVARAVEYAAPSGEALYVITLHGDPRAVAALDQEVSPTLTLSAERAERGGQP